MKSLYRGNPGGGFEFHLPGQILYFSKAVDLGTILPAIVALLLVFHDFPRNPAVLRRMAIMIPPWCGFFLVFCHPGELRNAFEILPLLLLLALETLAVLIRGGRISDELSAAVEAGTID